MGILPHAPCRDVFEGRAAGIEKRDPRRRFAAGILQKQQRRAMGFLDIRAIALIRAARILQPFGDALIVAAHPPRHGGERTEFVKAYAGVPLDGQQSLAR